MDLQLLLSSAGIVAGFLALGFFTGRWSARHLVIQIKDAREELARRDKFFHEQQRHHNQLMSAAFNRLGAVVDDGEKGRVLDRSPEKVAEIIQKEKREKAQQEWAAAYQSDMYEGVG